MSTLSSLSFSSNIANWYIYIYINKNWLKIKSFQCSHMIFLTKPIIGSEQEQESSKIFPICSCIVNPFVNLIFVPINFGHCCKQKIQNSMKIADFWPVAISSNELSLSISTKHKQTRQLFSLEVKIVSVLHFKAPETKFLHFPPLQTSKSKFVVDQRNLTSLKLIARPYF